MSRRARQIQKGPTEAAYIRSKTKALALRTQERRRTYCSFRNETHSTVSFPTPGRCANSLLSGI